MASFLPDSEMLFYYIRTRIFLFGTVSFTSIFGGIMKKLFMGMVMVLMVGSAAFVQADCTPEEAQKKAMDFAQAVQTKSQKDPAGYAQIMQELQPQLLELQQKQDMQALCKFYDEALPKLQ